jgi:hypothetical protein
MAKKHAHLHKHKSRKSDSIHVKKHKSHKNLPKYVNNDDEDIIDNSNIDINEVDDFDPEDNGILDEDKYNNEYQEDEVIEDEVNDEVIDDDDEVIEDVEEVRPKIKLADKTRERLKKKIVEWLDCDDKIKTLNTRTKKYKDAKKQQEDVIIKMITKLGMEDNKIDVHDNNDNLRSRVYRHKSVTKGSLKEDIIKDALMEAIRDEKKVDQLVKKIESKRPINERYYLKRTKGNKDE